MDITVQRNISHNTGILPELKKEVVDSIAAGVMEG